MIAKCSNDKVQKGKYTVANQYSKENPEGILSTGIANNTSISFYIKKYNDVNCGEDKNIPAKFYYVNIRQC